MIDAEPPPASPPPVRSPWPFGKFPQIGKKRTLIIIGCLVAIAVIVGAVLAVNSAQQGQRTPISEFAPKVKFIKFETERQEISVGENTNISFNVQNSEDRVIDDARVVVTVDPEVGKNYISISNSTVHLPVLNKDARTGEIKVTITATGTPAVEAKYDIRGILSVGGTTTDVKDFQLTIRQAKR
jgi:hypothetical protein